MKHARQISWSLAVLSLSSMASMTVAADHFSPNGVTKPVHRAEMSFVTQGLVKDVLVKPGDVIKVGQPLVQLDDSIERKQLDSMSIEANSDLQEKAANADLSQKRVDLTRKKQIQSNGGMNDAEVEDAQLAVTIGEIRVQLAKEETQKKKAECEAELKKIEKMVLISQINGVVDKVNSEPGEVTDPQKPALVAIDNSRLNIEASLPTAQVNRLKTGDAVEVQYEDEPQARKAKIVFLSPAADAASGTRLLRAEMLNTDNRPSGMSVAVKLPDAVLTASDK